MYVSYRQARRQNLAAGGPKTRRGQKPEEEATFLKYSIGCMQQPVGQTWNWGAPISNGGDGHHCPPRWRRPCLSVCICTYCATRSKNALRVSWCHLKWLHWHNFFTIERCQVSALLNVHVSLSFSLDGQLNMLRVSSYTGQNPWTTVPRKKVKQVS